jgi:hypothetical protein
MTLLTLPTAAGVEPLFLTANGGYFLKSVRWLPRGVIRKMCDTPQWRRKVKTIWTG